MTRNSGDVCQRPERGPGRKRKKLSEEDQRLAIRMLVAGLRKIDIAAVFGMSPDTLRRILSRRPEWRCVAVRRDGRGRS